MSGQESEYIPTRPGVEPADVCQVCHGSGSVWKTQGDGDPDYEVDCLACHPDAPADPAPVPPANPWMADSRPLLAEIKKLAKERDEAKLTASKILCEWGAIQIERDALRAALERCRGIIPGCYCVVNGDGSISGCESCSISDQVGEALSTPNPTKEADRG